MTNSYYKKGSWNAICDVCGMEEKADKLLLRWDGLRVHRRCWEPRHPQDFVRAKIDIQAVPWSRPESSDTFLPVVSPGSSSSVAGYAIAGYAITGVLYSGDIIPPGTFTP